MKAKELIDAIKEYPDFEINVCLNLDANKAPNERPRWSHVGIKELVDIGHSSKQIIFDIKDTKIN